jgi:signal transduction histidine kinase
MRLKMRSAATLGGAAGSELAEPARGTGLRHLVPAPVLDAVIAIAIAVLGLASGLGARAQHEHMPPAAIALLVLMGLALYPRRRFPAGMLAAVAAMVAALAVMGVNLGGSFLAVLCACYSAAVYGSRRLVIALFAGAVAAVLLIGIPQAFGVGRQVTHAVPVPTILAAAGAALFGLLIKGQFAARNAALAVMAERAEWASAQREQEARRATLAERLRIARELHDIIAHHVSVIVIQAQGAQRVAGREPDRAVRAMADVESTARTALEEMRRMLGLLRPPGDVDGEREAAAGGLGVARGIADLGELAATMTAAGLPVTLRTTGEPYPVPEDVGLTVYRITQEALTNALKHAGPAQAEVHLCYGEDLELSVTDDGRGAAAGLPGPATPGAGRGTTGMRERAAMLGGTFTAGPRAGGGYQVHATLPCQHDGGPAIPAQRESEPH